MDIAAPVNVASSETRHRLAPFFRPFLVIAVLVFADAVFFRAPIANRFTRLWGDSFDGGIEASLLEHWFNVLRGYSYWSQTNYFYPEPDTIGYNDGFFLFGVIHSLFRSLGYDIFVSSQLTDISVKSVGFISFFLLSRALYRSRLVYACLGATIFTIVHASYAHAFHQQLLGVSFAPLVGYLAVRAYQEINQNRPGRFAWFGAGAALLYGAWLLTSYYMAWFFGFLTIVMSAAAVFAGGVPFSRRLLFLLARYWAHSTIVVGVLLLAVWPFLWAYLPKADETGMHSWAETLMFEPVPNDILNIGSGNFLFGRLAQRICADCTVGNGEINASGFPPLQFYLYICAVAWAVLRYAGPGQMMLRMTAIASVVTWLLLFQYGDLAAWELVWDWMPGAKGLRVVSRYQIFLTFPVALLSMAYFEAKAIRMPTTMVVLVAAVLLLEQLGSNAPRSDRADMLARIAVPPPPADCQSFFVTEAKGQDASTAIMALYPHNVEAMLVAELVHVPTINGFATFLPPGWAFRDPTAPDYIERVRGYAERFDLHGLCKLDLENLRWSEFRK